jgi:hypothetical protein
MNDMKTEKPYLIDILTTLADHDVNFIVCGGMAVVFHGVERMTMDVDISLDLSPDNVKKFLSAVLEMKLAINPLREKDKLDIVELKKIMGIV